MILEGIVTTISPDGQLNVAPMGPRVTPAMDRFTLRPFKTAQTFQNLAHHGEGVLHVTDDVLLLARAAVGRIDPFPDVERANSILGYVLRDTCRYYEFRVASIDDRDDRVTIEAETLYKGGGRDFFGFNRAKHAVVEAAILATRTHILPAEQIQEELTRLATIVDKTAGDQERRAFDFLKQHIEKEAMTNDQ
jgi:hypothetical protein